MECSYCIERHALQILRPHHEHLGQLAEGVNCGFPNVCGTKRLPGNRRLPLERPPNTIGNRLNPALEATLTAEIDSAITIGVAGVRDNHPITLSALAHQATIAASAISR